jgi:hypothetical protein
MAERKQDLLGQLADLSEAAIQKLSEAPGADRVLHALKGLGDRVDDLQRRTKGYEELERRLTALEKKVSGLAKSSSATDSPTGKKS